MNQLTITHTRAAEATWPNWQAPALFYIPCRKARALEGQVVYALHFSQVRSILRLPGRSKLPIRY